MKCMIAQNVISSLCLAKLVCVYSCSQCFLLPFHVIAQTIRYLLNFPSASYMQFGVFLRACCMCVECKPTFYCKAGKLKKLLCYCRDARCVSSNVFRLFYKRRSLCDDFVSFVFLLFDDIRLTELKDTKNHNEKEIDES